MEADFPDDGPRQCVMIKSNFKFGIIIEASTDQS